MPRSRFAVGAVLLAALLFAAKENHACDAQSTSDDGFRPLFNGKDFAGWQDFKGVNDPFKHWTILDKALVAKPGSVIDLDLDRSWRGGYHYEVEVLDAELREWEVHVDAKTGKVLSVERDWFD